MKRWACVLLLSCASSALADEVKVPDFVEPFVNDHAGAVAIVTGDFGPAKDTTIVVTWDVMGNMPFAGFAVVPDKKGHKKLALPSFGRSSLDGEVAPPLAVNVDKDPETELVLGLHAQLSGGGYTYGGYVYVVLDYRGKKFVRMKALEKKLATAMEAREEDKTAPLTDDEIRKVLGVH